MMVRGTLVVREDIDLMVRLLLQFSTLAVPTRCSAPHSHRISLGEDERVVPSRSIPTTHRRPYGRQVFIPPICTPSRTPFCHTRRHRSLHQLPPFPWTPLLQTASAIHARVSLQHPSMLTNTCICRTNEAWSSNALTFNQPSCQRPAWRRMTRPPLTLSPGPVCDLSVTPLQPPVPCLCL